MKKRTFFLSLILPLILTAKLYGDELTIDRILSDYLPRGSRYEKTLSKEAKNVLEKTRREERGIKSRIFIFSLPGNFELALEKLGENGLEFSDWDQEAARRVRPPALQSGKRGSLDPLDVPNFRRATAASEGNLFVLQSHRFDLQKKIWKKGTTLEVYVPSSTPPDPSSKSPSPRR